MIGRNDLNPFTGKNHSQNDPSSRFGEVKEYSYLRLRELSPYLLETLKKLGALKYLPFISLMERAPCGLW